MKEVLEWSHYLCASIHPGCKVSGQGIPNRPASSLCPCFVQASPMENARKRTDLQLHCQASAMFVSCSTWILCHKLRTLQTRLRTGVCETLISWRLKRIRTIAAVYVTFNLAWWAVTQRTTKLFKLECGTFKGLVRIWFLMGKLWECYNFSRKDLEAFVNPRAQAWAAPQL